MTKTILIFGAGINQLELIREAKILGIQTVVIDPSENPPGKEEADFYYQVEGKDYDTTKAIALKHKVDGIVTGQMEKPMRLMAKLALEMGYIFHTPDVVETSLDKELMKQVFLAHNLPCAQHVTFTKDQKISQEKIQHLKFPLIVKPADAFSSRGVRKVDNFEELLNEENQTRQYSQKAKIVVEEFLEGKEFSVESITYQGKTEVIQITEKIITPYPYTVELGHLQPANINKEQWTEIEHIVKKSINAIGIDNSASHAEIMLTKQGPKIIEVGARLGGDFIASYLTKASTGVSMDKAAIQVALGIKPDIKRLYTRHSKIKYIDLEVGKKVKEIKPLNEIERQPGFVFLHIFVQPGDKVKKITHSAERAACIIFEANKKNVLLERIKMNEQLLKSKIILE